MRHLITLAVVCAVALGMASQSAQSFEASLKAATRGLSTTFAVLNN